MAGGVRCGGGADRRGPGRRGRASAAPGCSWWKRNAASEPCPLRGMGAPALGLELAWPARARVQAVEGCELCWRRRGRRGRRGRRAAACGQPGWMLDRRSSDHALAARAAAAGAELWAGAAYLGSGPAPGSHLVKRGSRVEEVRAAVVVGADGAASLVARRLALPPQPLLAGVQCEVPLARSLDRTVVLLEPASAWATPGSSPRGIPQPGAGLRGAGPGRPALGGLAGAAGGPGLAAPRDPGPGRGRHPGGRAAARIWREGVVLCGDAAGLTHPVTGAGIPQALASGRLAGRAAAALAGGGRRRPGGRELCRRPGRGLRPLPGAGDGGPGVPGRGLG